jgi:hypothetical protein
MSFMRRIAFPALVLSALALGACSKTDSTPTPGTDAGKEAGPSPTDPTFTNVWRGVFVGNGCTQTQCHGASRAGLLRLDSKKTAYTDLVGVKAQGPCIKATDAGGGDSGKADAAPAMMTPDPGANVAVCGCAPSGQTRVVAGKPEESLLIEKITAAQSCGDRMPPTGELVVQDQIDMVTKWIAAGANND